MFASWKESYDKPRQCIKKQRHHFADKGSYSQSYGISSGYVQMWEFDHKEVRVLKNWCFQTVMLEKTLESSLDSKEIKLVNPKGNQHWTLIRRTDAKAEAPVLWPPDAESWLIWKWRWERLRAGGEGDDRGWDGWMASWIQWIWVWANSGKWWGTGRSGIVGICSPWGHKELDTTWRLNNSNSWFMLYSRN